MSINRVIVSHSLLFSQNEKDYINSVMSLVILEKTLPLQSSAINSLHNVLQYFTRKVNQSTTISMFLS